ncbi:MAG: DUF4113 domain-containing protein [Paludibacteraceae bacterium]
MREHVINWTGIPISVGIAPTKALAKTAKKIVKKISQQTGGCHVIDSDEKRIKALKWLKIEDVWGIGRRNMAKLSAIKVKNAYEFTLLDENWVKSNMTIVGLNLQRDLKGIPSIEMLSAEKSQSISNTRTFERAYTTYEKIKERLVMFTSLSAEKLRQQHSLCNRVSIFVETSRFNEKEEAYANSLRIKLPFPTYSTPELINCVVKGLQQIYKQGYKYKRAGVVLFDFIDEKDIQLALFSELNSNPKHKAVMYTMDSVNQKYHCMMVSTASQDKKKYKLKQEKLSNAYTTDINQGIIIQV